MARYIVGLTGHKGSGKDTLGSILVEEHGFTRIGLADVVKDAVYALNPVAGGTTVQELVDNEGWDWTKNNVPEARRLLDAMGTKVGRDMFGEDFWTEQAQRRIDAIVGDVVITDVRFQNEGRMCDLVVRVTRTGVVVDTSLTSEVSVDSVVYDMMVFNDGTVADLQDDAATIAFYGPARERGELEGDISL